MMSHRARAIGVTAVVLGLMLCGGALARAEGEVAAGGDASAAPRAEAGLVEPTAAVLVHAAAIEKLVRYVQPIVERTALGATIPGIDGKHISFPSFKLAAFSLGEVRVGFKSPHLIMLVFRGVTLRVPSIPCYVFVTIFGRRHGCHGTLSAKVNAIDLIVKIAVGRSASGDLALLGVKAKVLYAKVQVEPEFHSFWCKLAEGVLKVALGDFNTLINKLMFRLLPSVIEKALKAGVETALREHPVPIASGLLVRQDGLVMDFPLLKTMRPLPSLMPPAFRGIPNRDLEFSISDASINGMSAAATAGGRLRHVFHLPASMNTSSLSGVLRGIDEVCHACPLLVSATLLNQSLTTRPETLDNIAMIRMMLIAVNGTGRRSRVHLLDVTSRLRTEVANLTAVGPRQERVYFNLALRGLSVAAVHLSVRPVVPPRLLIQVLVSIVRRLLRRFNHNFKGVALPSVGGFSAQRLAINLSNTTVQVGADLVLPRLSARVGG